MIRWLKIILVIFVGLQGLFYFLSNAFNWSSAKLAVGAVLGQQDSPFYSTLVVPSITDPTLVAIALIGIMGGELLIGLLCLNGALDMARASSSTPEAFHHSKKLAILGCGLALIVWFGIFQVFGAALFQMWQGEVGISSFEGAFMYHASSALVLLFVNQRDD